MLIGELWCNQHFPKCRLWPANCWNQSLVFGKITEESSLRPQREHRSYNFASVILLYYGSNQLEKGLFSKINGHIAYGPLGSCAPQHSKAPWPSKLLMLAYQRLGVVGCCFFLNHLNLLLQCGPGIGTRPESSAAGEWTTPSDAKQRELGAFKAAFTPLNGVSLHTRPLGQQKISK